MPRTRFVALALLLLPITAARAQEYQVALAVTRASTHYKFTDANGDPAPYQPEARSAFAPSLFGDVQAPILTAFDVRLTIDAGLRWPLGSDVGVIFGGLGVARQIEDGYVGLHYLASGQVNGTAVLGQDWNISAGGIYAVVRRGPYRFDVKRLVDRDLFHSSYGTDVRTFSDLALAARYGKVGVEIERWRDKIDAATGVLSLSDFNRLSVFVSFGQFEAGRR